MKKLILALAAAASLAFSAQTHAQGAVVGTINQIVQPSAGRQALPVGTQIKGGVDLGEVIAGSQLTLPNNQVLLDVLVMQVRRDPSGRVIGGTVSNKWGSLAQLSGSAPAPSPVATPEVSTGTASTVAKGAGMSGTLSPGMIAAVALGAAVLIGSGGGSTPSHGQ